MSQGSMVLLDAAGRRRSPATRPGYLAGRAPRWPSRKAVGAWGWGAAAAWGARPGTLGWAL
jgi:hypothetical protein